MWGPHPVESILNPSVEGFLHLTPQRLVLSWGGGSCSVPLNEITQVESSKGGIASAMAWKDLVSGGTPPTLSLVSKVALSSSYEGRGTFFDPQGHSMGFRLKEGDAAEIRDVLSCYLFYDKVEMRTHRWLR